MNSTEIGQYLSNLRKHYKLTQDQLADKLGVSRQAISKWETGSSLPDIELFEQISDLYGVSINDIVKADISKFQYRQDARFTDVEIKRKKISVIGCGRWGSFIGWYLDKLGHSVSIYGRLGSANMKNLMDTRMNEYVELPASIQLTTDITSIQKAEIIVISIDAQSLTELVEQMAALELKNKMIVLCMKGIEISSGRRLTQIVDDSLDHSNKVAVWLGPGHPQEFSNGIPNCMVIDSNDEFIKKELIKLFSSKLIRFYYGTDLVGNEIGAASKNVIGIAAGMLDGLGMSTLKGALMSRGTKEIGKLIEAMGGKEDSVYGLCHLGDYEATVFSEYSHNRAFGENFVKGVSYNKLAEGYFTVKALRNLGKNYGIELPICEAVYQILYCSAKPSSILNMLFDRNLKTEF
ncbi:MAG TPA: helix-turn-helix domain-containing protein [Lachnospiraceae bacterium]|nr:helix-turn-helix domain-containing protein [Lachnospiraceae bacterium]